MELQDDRFDGFALKMERIRQRKKAWDFAIEIGVNPTHLSLVENNRRPLTAGVAFRAAEALGIPLDALKAANEIAG